MKLFLASHNFGKYVETLKEMVGANCRTLLITNARDFLPAEERNIKVTEKLELFREHGFDVRELDLRNYFGKLPEELDKAVSSYNPGLIYCIGGDMFFLATALNVSGMSDIIRRRTLKNQSVYGGCSAGAIVASDDVEIYERDELQVETLPDYYGVESVTSGLGLIREYIVPHADVEKFAERTEFYQSQLAKIHAEQILLNDADVYIVDGKNKEIKRG